MRTLILLATALGLLTQAAWAEDLTGKWSYGLTSRRTGEPLIDEGGRHNIDPSAFTYGFVQVVSSSGAVLRPSGAPLAGGEQLSATDSYQDDANTREYARIVAIMALVRDTILYDFETTSRAQWLAVTDVLTRNGVKTHDAESINPRAILSTEQVYDYVAGNPSEGSPVMRYLEEAELELKCLAFTDFNFTNPEGDNHCEQHNLAVGSGLK